jgi:hypothetical protein
LKDATFTETGDKELFPGKAQESSQLLTVKFTRINTKVEF